MTESSYLVGLRLAGKKVVVVGGGTVAQRRLPLLIACGADVHIISRGRHPGGGGDGRNHLVGAAIPRR